MKLSIFHIDGDHSATRALPVHDEVQGKVLHEKLRIMAKCLPVQSVKHTVASTISNAGASVGLSSFSILEALTSKGALVDLSLVCAAEGHSVVLELDDGSRCFFCHVLNGILISEPVSTLHGVVVVPPPIVLTHVAQSGVDATLSSHSVGASGEKLGDAGSLEAIFNEAYSGSKASASRTDNKGIVSVVNYFIASYFRCRKGTRWLY
jgi:hypothetical protein